MDIYIDGMPQLEVMDYEKELLDLDFTVSYFHEDNGSWLTMVIEDIDKIPFYLEGVIDIYIDEWERAGYRVTEV